MNQYYRSVIEEIFPTTLISLETYKERKAGAGQILTALGKWWGRKPLSYVRAVLLGILMPASDDKDKDLDIYLKLLGLGQRELELRKNKTIEPWVKYFYLSDAEKKNYGARVTYKGASSELMQLPPEKAFENAKQEEKTRDFNITFTKLSREDAKQLELSIFHRLPYDLKIRYCEGLDKVSNLTDETWQEINEYLGTDAHSYPEFVEQMGKRRFGEVPTVGDPFCGGGSIPFEAARLGFNVYASDLNPLAAALTWSAVNLFSLPEERIEELKDFQKRVYDLADKQITEWGIEHNSKGHRAKAYIYLNEVICPDCGWRIPLSPTWVISQKKKTVAKLKENPALKSFDIDIVSNVSSKELKDAQQRATVKNGKIVCPHCGHVNAPEVIRGDKKLPDGTIKWGLREWEKHEFLPRADDVFQERLYCIMWIDENGDWYYAAPTKEDMEREKRVVELLSERFQEWQKKGYIPSDRIEDGEKTSEPIRNRGWRYWHQLFNPRQLLLLGLLSELVDKEAKTKEEKLVGMIGINKVADWSSKLSMWNANINKPDHTFYNQALNTLYNYGARGLPFLTSVWYVRISEAVKSFAGLVEPRDAKLLNHPAHIWLTDPPYADAINYEEISEFFLAWDKKWLSELFPDWYTSSMRDRAIKGKDDAFEFGLGEALQRIEENTIDDGYVAIMFTHQSTQVYAALVNMLLQTNLKVLNAWSVSTETEAGGLKEGNYVQSTVTIVLQKDPRSRREVAFIQDLLLQTRKEIEKQINDMSTAEKQSRSTLFSPADYELAGSYAALRVLTSYNLQASQEEIEMFIDDMRQYASSLVLPKGLRVLNLDLDEAKDFWNRLNPYEKYYIRGLELEGNGERKLKAFQDAAKSLQVYDYNKLLADTRPNKARLKTAWELGQGRLSPEHAFSNTDLFRVLHALYVARKKADEEGDETFGIEAGFEWLRQAFGLEYFSKKSKIELLLRYIAQFKDFMGMDYWRDDARIASHIADRVSADRM